MLPAGTPKALAASLWLGKALTHALRAETPLVSFEVSGMTLTAPAHFIGLYVMRRYEPLLVRWLQSTLTKGLFTVDVGAHIGFISMIMARAVGDEGNVLAVEPATENVRLLERNLRVNGISNVRIVAAAADSHTGHRAFHLTGSTDSHGFYEHPLTETHDTVDVETFRLDDLVTGPVDLVKIDVEGAELDVLAGMERMLGAGLSRLVVEWTPSCQRAAGRRITELPSALESLGFSLRVLDDVRGRERTVDEVKALWNRGELDDSWYANLIAERRS